MNQKNLNWRKLAEKIAKKHKWIAWVETQIRYKANTYDSQVIGYETSFKKKAEPSKCPHCGKPISSAPNVYLYISEPRNIICWEKDETKAWKGLVEQYLKIMKLSLSQLKLQLDISGV